MNVTAASRSSTADRTRLLGEPLGEALLHLLVAGHAAGGSGLHAVFDLLADVELVLHIFQSAVGRKLLDEIQNGLLYLTHSLTFPECYHAGRRRQPRPRRPKGSPEVLSAEDLHAALRLGPAHRRGRTPRAAGSAGSFSSTSPSAPPRPSPSTSGDDSAQTAGPVSSSPSPPPGTWSNGIATDTFSSPMGLSPTTAPFTPSRTGTRKR